MHEDSVNKILEKLGKKASGQHDKNKIIESIRKTSDAAARAAQDLLDKKITQEQFDKITNKFEGISEAQWEFWNLLRKFKD